MSPSSRTRQPAQRRPRAEKACSFCRAAKVRCEPSEYGTNDLPCRRCITQRLDCTIPRTARSQSPSVQGPEPVRHPAVPQSAGGATETLMPGSEADVQYALRRSKSVCAPMQGLPPLSGTAVLSPGQDASQAPSLLPLASNMGDYQQGFPNVATNPEYYPQQYYQDGQIIPYMTSYAASSRSGTGDASNLGYDVEGPQPDDPGAFADEQDHDAGLSNSSET